MVIGRPPMSLHFDGDHLPRFCQLTDKLIPITLDRHKRPMKQHDWGSANHEPHSTC